MSLVSLSKCGVALLLICCFAAQAAMYRWEEDGVIQYGQRPPPGVDVELMKPPPPPPSNTGQRPVQPQQRAEPPNEGRQQRSVPQQEQLVEKERQEIIKRNCDIARRNLQALTERNQVRLKEGDNYRIMGEDERQQRIATAKKNIQEFCL